jgi:hypothetical protein
MMSSFVLRSYGEAYIDVSFDAYDGAPTRWLANDTGGVSAMAHISAALCGGPAEAGN